MTTTAPRPAASVSSAPRIVNLPLVATVGLATALLAVGGLLLPDRTVGPGMSGPTMTHYMGLLGVNQPWNLLLFMAVPVILAETLAITELVLLFRSDAPSWVHTTSRAAGLVAGPLMVGIVFHLMTYAVVPLTVTGGWRGPADVIAVLFYLFGAVPLVGITLVELGLVGRDEQRARRWHVLFVGAFLVVAHVAMIFGMLDPSVLGWSASHVMPGGELMPGMNHG